MNADVEFQIPTGHISGVAHSSIKAIIFNKGRTTIFNMDGLLFSIWTDYYFILDGL